MATHTTTKRPTGVPVGPIVDKDGVHFRVWGPKLKNLALVLEADGRSIEMTPEKSGYFAIFVEGIGPGTRYRFRVDNDEKLYPDPATQSQPEGPHGPSEVVDHAAFKWTDSNWPGVKSFGQVLYEFHCGVFTPEGTWAAAMEKLPLLKDIGITCLEIMPVAAFPGRWNWGYDGVCQFAPTHTYGTPDDFRRFIDRCHALGIGAILDLVYNHLGPDGNYIPVFSDKFFNNRKMTDWGIAINYDGEQSRPVREYYIANACYWIEQFHLDGFRFDATQAIVDSSPKHLLAEITEAARKAAGKRSIYIINENEPQQTHLVCPISEGGFGMDALWNDDFHHSARVAVCGRQEGYYRDHPGRAQEFVSGAKYGYIYQGQRYDWQKKRRGTPALDLPPTVFVNFVQNHDQIANSGTGQRLHLIGHPGSYRAITALLLLGPQTPMLFMGQEFAASSPFYYFADHNSELGQLICAGRKKEISQFPSMATKAFLDSLPDPCSRESFDRSKLDWSEYDKPRHREAVLLHKELIRIRREDPIISRVHRRGEIDGAVLAERAFVLRFFGPDHDDRLLVVNLGNDLSFVPAPEPLLAPPKGKRWKPILSTEEPRFGGSGVAAPDTEDEGWLLTTHCATLLVPASIEEAEIKTRIVHSGTAQGAFDKNDYEMLQ